MSVSNVAVRRGNILDEIMAYHRQALPRQMREVPLADVRALAALAPPPLDFTAALRRPGVTLIAECKKASPSKGLLAPHYDPVELARAYLRAGAGAISVLTDGRHFQGSLADLRDVKEAIHAPVLRKDFIFHPYQVYEARAAGADAILLIAAVLADGELKELLELAGKLGMAALVEIHDEEELGRALSLRPSVIGINNRDLRTFQVDFDNTRRLRRLVPEGILTVSESGIRAAEDVRQMAALGIHAVLVGEALVKSKDPYLAARSLVEAGRET
ncbi:MAG: indole-3-glycerol phosphate synthase TrpC [Chloroflexota bacterium]